MRTAASMMLAASCLLAPLFATPLVGTADAKPSMDGRERAIVRAINRQRSKRDLSKLRSSARLARAADYHSREMLDADYFAHESRDGSSFDQRIRRFVDLKALGETLAMVGGCGRRSARRIVRMWMKSPGHRAILLSSRFRKVGLGKRVGDYRGSRACLVTADFGSRK